MNDLYLVFVFKLLFFSFEGSQDAIFSFEVF